ncbi:RNA-binding protein [Methyloligella solikamskensis]|uniref:RNA-binding protein n=1 Tax=Methyloligella solikamskensis TaxID=1177756 RepID=A0ABW3JCS3_9HYPH
MQELAQAETSPTAEAEKDSPSLRRCALTRASREKHELIRFVASPDGEAVPDLKEKLPGRGVWITADHASVAEAAKRNAFGRGLKTSLKVPPGLADRVGQMLNEAALSALGLANKAGEVTCGFAKVEAAIKRDRVLALVHASDAAEDGCKKLDAKFRARAEHQTLPPIRGFTAEQLSLVLGRPNVIHAALARGGAAKNFIEAANRAERYFLGSGAFEASIGPDTDTE